MCDVYSLNVCLYDLYSLNVCLCDLYSLNVCLSDLHSLNVCLCNLYSLNACLCYFYSLDVCLCDFECLNVNETAKIIRKILIISWFFTLKPSWFPNYTPCNELQRLQCSIPCGCNSSETAWWIPYIFGRMYCYKVKIRVLYCHSDSTNFVRVMGHWLPSAVQNRRVLGLF